jgi:hypothetical protein
MKQPCRAPQPVSVITGLGLLLLAAVGAGQAAEALVPVVKPVDPSASNRCLQWEQPPIEWDVLSKTPYFCGWDEPSYDEEIPNATESSSSVPADDFRCIGPMPITSIHWWGSYQTWESLSPPALAPDAWRITFWANTPADAYVSFSRPGTQLRQFEVAPDRIEVQWVAYDRFPDQPSDSCFRYSLALEPTEYFWPDTHEGDIFWIGITALYKTRRPDHVWGWKTRPWTWMDGAIEFVSGQSTTPSGPISFINILEVTKRDACGQTSKFDMAFALDTDPDWVKWEQPFTGLRDWPGYADERSTATGLRASSIAFKWQQQPDQGRTGLAVDATADTPRTWSAQILADDFECTLSGPVTQIQLWGSYMLDQVPSKDPANPEFTLSIRADVPAPGHTGISMPGKVLWTKTFKKGQFTVQESTSEKQGFSSPCNGQYILNDHSRAFQYTFSIDPSQAFVQTGTADKPVIYWLSVQASIAQAPVSMSRFGWKTSTSTWNDDAVWAQAKEPYSGTWQKLNYPAVHPRVGQHTALAFAILTSHQSTAQVIDRQVADDWRCEQPAPVVAATWWGSYVGYTYEACACTDQVQPVQPDYFLLSIWSDAPDPDPNDPQDFSHPGQRLWEVEATQYDEVLVGYDGHQGEPRTQGQEAVFRYSVRLPQEEWFTQGQGTNVYWFSVVAVYEYPKVANYPWGWTNHEHVFNDDAVAGSEVIDVSGKKVWTWQPLKDQTGTTEDMSFVLFQQAQILGPPPLP